MCAGGWEQLSVQEGGEDSDEEEEEREGMKKDEGEEGEEGEVRCTDFLHVLILQVNKSCDVAT